MRTRVSPLIIYSILLLVVFPLLTSLNSTYLQYNKPGRAYIKALLENNPDDFGFTSGTFTVSDNGAATYEIPLMTPPGTGGMAPKLSIVYNSQAGNGLLGDGWNLNGLSIISRAPSTMAQDNLIDGVDFDGNDKFMLDGQRLVIAPGQDEISYGRNGTEYRTEQNSFRRIISFGGGEAESFKVFSKEGLIYYYGDRKEANSRVLASGVKDKIFYWLVDKIEDRNGNYILINYESFNDGTEYRPESIEYTGNDNPSAELKPYNLVKFNYKDRDDKHVRFIGGSKTTLSKLLINISTYYSEYDGAAKENLVRQYKFDYGETPITKKNILASFEECTGFGPNEDCLKPTKFAYSNEGKIEFNNVQPTTYKKQYSEDFKTFYGDLNKDGLPDKLLLKPATDKLIVDYYLNIGNGKFSDRPIDTLLTVQTSNEASVFINDSDAWLFRSDGATLFGQMVPL